MEAKLKHIADIEKKQHKKIKEEKEVREHTREVKLAKVRQSLNATEKQ